MGCLIPPEKRDYIYYMPQLNIETWFNQSIWTIFFFLVLIIFFKDFLKKIIESIRIKYFIKKQKSFKNNIIEKKFNLLF